MTDRPKYTPGPAAGAQVKKQEGESWTLVLVRDLRHPPTKVWDALTDPKQLAAWAPYDADHSLASAGPVKLTTFGAPMPPAAETVKRAEPPKVLEHSWTGNDLRWELEPKDGGTRLTLWIAINKRYIAWGAAGWHLCFDSLAHLLAGDPIGRMAGPEIMKFEGWQRLSAEYAKQFGV